MSFEPRIYRMAAQSSTPQATEASTFILAMV